MVKVSDDGMFPVSRDKVWRLLEAHGTDISNIHPNVKSQKSLNREGSVREQQIDMGGQVVRRVVKLTPNPPEKMIIEFLEGPVTGRMVNTYTEIPGGTKVVTECELKSSLMDDKKLEITTKQILNDVFNEDLRYLAKMK